MRNMLSFGIASPLFCGDITCLRTIHRPATQPRTIRRVSPSIVDPATAEPFTLEQELKPFGAWVGEPIWVPPKDSSRNDGRDHAARVAAFASRRKSVGPRSSRNIAAISPKCASSTFSGFHSTSQRKVLCHGYRAKALRQDYRSDPHCVQTRLEEFLSGPAKAGVKVYYLKPLCVEIGDELILTTREDLTAAITKVQEEVFAEYRRLALYRRPLQAMVAVPPTLVWPFLAGVVNYVVGRKQKAIDALQAHLEFKRRKLALDAAKTYGKCRTDGCTFDEMLELTSPLKRTDVIDQYCIEQELSSAKRAQLLRMAAGTMPWFVALSLTISTFRRSPSWLHAADHRLRPSLRRRNARLPRRGPEDWPLRRSRRHHPRRDLVCRRRNATLIRRHLAAGERVSASVSEPLCRSPRSLPFMA